MPEKSRNFCSAIVTLICTTLFYFFWSKSEDAGLIRIDDFLYHTTDIEGNPVTLLVPLKMTILIGCLLAVSAVSYYGMGRLLNRNHPFRLRRFFRTSRIE
jgi:hypothetical protein